jgi:hypothetical protein
LARKSWKKSPLPTDNSRCPFDVKASQFGKNIL